MRTLISVSILLPLMACSGAPSKYELDSEVKRLCAVDGGVKVYETVSLPADQFNEYGQINFYDPPLGENTLGTEYVFKKEVFYYFKGSPEMSRTHYRVMRRSDQKLLGETVLYGRGGGDLPGPLHDSSFVCPPYADASDVVMLTRIFKAKKN